MSSSLHQWRCSWSLPRDCVANLDVGNFETKKNNSVVFDVATPEGLPRDPWVTSMWALKFLGWGFFSTEFVYVCVIFEVAPCIAYFNANAANDHGQSKRTACFSEQLVSSAWQLDFLQTLHVDFHYAIEFWHSLNTFPVWDSDSPSAATFATLVLVLRCQRTYCSLGMLSVWTCGTTYLPCWTKWQCCTGKEAKTRFTQGGIPSQRITVADLSTGWAVLEVFLKCLRKWSSM